MTMISHDTTSLKTTLDETTGFLKAPVTLARVGVQVYRGYEVGLTGDRLMDKVGVFRPPSEVFSPDSLSSFENMVVTDNHPPNPVTVDNVKDLQKGNVSSINNTDNAVNGFISITDKSLINKIKDGKVEVSVGYSHDLRKESGTYQGQDYEFVQTDIRGNHLAVVQAGRCGPSCKITTDDRGGPQMLITIDGLDFETDDKQLAQAVKKLQKSHDAEKKEMKENFKKKFSKKEEDMEEVVKKKDKAEAEKEAMSKDSLTDDALNKLVADRAVMIADATAVIGDAMPDCGCPNKIMDAVISHVYPDLSMDGKSVDYITATYDMAITKAKKSKDSVDNLGKDFSKDKKTEITRDSARAKYMKDQGFTVEDN